MYRSCMVCGSDKIIPNLELQDGGPYPSETHGFRVVTNPGALLRKDISRRIIASVCGNCGYVAFFADAPHELYEAYTQAQQAAK